MSQPMTAFFTVGRFPTRPLSHGRRHRGGMMVHDEKGE
jgi:hypothetical protein